MSLKILRLERVEEVVARMTSSALSTSPVTNASSAS